ncbi:RagB/SusD family nutrient uptake outer membrane protein [Aquiflexum sp.]|uniref:RagB/SusD family nutrient uptake outer membrane protein n=1 Tax=Aquiflexum sp. TaxID=1872584 RepID=UPI00359379F4
MKNIIYKLKISLVGLLVLINLGCDENAFLEEIPLDFFSPENSYRNFEDFQSALTDLYARVRFIHSGTNDNVQHFVHWMSTDIAFHVRKDPGRFGSHTVWLIPTNGAIEFHWNEWYKIISNANTILDRIEIVQMTDAQKSEIIAEAKFFRAFSYRYLVYLYGGVPLILEEITSPRVDFSRASKEEILNQIVLDATEASQNLPGISQVVDGKVSKLVAFHLLAETLISLGRFDEAIVAATTIIDDPATQLMTSRFGVSANRRPIDPYLQFTQDGDPYWDLFQAGNQNRASGNREALWVLQYELDIPGGLFRSSGGYYNGLERWASPVAFLTFRDPENQEGSLGDGQSNYNTGGRGVSFMRNTDFYLNTLWESDWDNDIRNAPHNIVRDYVYTNPNSNFFMRSSLEFPSPTLANQDWRWYPYPSKVTTPGDHPSGLIIDNDLLLLNTQAGATYRDMYLFRLAETYLLRAEAYLGRGDLANAANDINAVRSRANATPVSPGQVNLDYILDERARELVYEEPRRLHLHRTGTLVERVRKYNAFNSNEIRDYHALWPIPFREIESNKNGDMPQNPGYN